MMIPRHNSTQQERLLPCVDHTCLHLRRVSCCRGPHICCAVAPLHFPPNCQRPFLGAAGADFELVAPEKTYLRSSKPVVAVCAVSGWGGYGNVCGDAGETCTELCCHKSLG